MGEGPHDIGRPAYSPAEPGVASGTLPALARSVVHELDGDSLAIRWTELSRFDPLARKKQSGKPEKRPKRLLAELAAQAHLQDCADLRARIAEKSDVDELSRACRQGFAPFAAELRKTFARLV